MAVKIGTFYRCNNGVSHVQDTPTLWLTVTNIYWYHLISSQKLTLSMLLKGFGRGFSGDPSWPGIKILGIYRMDIGWESPQWWSCRYWPDLWKMSEFDSLDSCCCQNLIGQLWLQATFPGLHQALRCEKSSQVRSSPIINSPPKKESGSPENRSFDFNLPMRFTSESSDKWIQMGRRRWYHRNGWMDINRKIPWDLRDLVLWVAWFVSLGSDLFCDQPVKNPKKKSSTLQLRWNLGSLKFQGIEHPPVMWFFCHSDIAHRHSSISHLSISRVRLGKDFCARRSTYVVWVGSGPALAEGQLG